MTHEFTHTGTVKRYSEYYLTVENERESNLRETPKCWIDDSGRRYRKEKDGWCGRHYLEFETIRKM